MTNRIERGLRMRNVGIIAVFMLIWSIGSAFGACDLGYNTTDVHNWTCLKIVYLGPEGRNLTIDIYDLANHNCSANTTMTSFMDSAGHCVINGRHNPYETCKCQHPEPCGPDCTCTKDLTFLELMNRSMMFLGGKA
jgi:hypothetical protein